MKTFLLLACCCPSQAPVLSLSVYYETVSTHPKLLMSGMANGRLACPSTSELEFERQQKDSPLAELVSYYRPWIPYDKTDAEVWRTSLDNDSACDMHGKVLSRRLMTAANDLSIDMTRCCETSLSFFSAVEQRAVSLRKVRMHDLWSAAWLPQWLFLKIVNYDVWACVHLLPQYLLEQHCLPVEKDVVSTTCCDFSLRHFLVASSVR